MSFVIKSPSPSPKRSRYIQNYESVFQPTFKQINQETQIMLQQNNNLLQHQNQLQNQENDTNQQREMNSRISCYQQTTQANQFFPIRFKNTSNETLFVKCYNGSDTLNLVSVNKGHVYPNQYFACFSHTQQAKVNRNGNYHIIDKNGNYKYDGNRQQMKYY